MEDKILNIIQSGITHFDDILNISKISKKKLNEYLDILVDKGILYHKNKSKIYGYIKEGTIIIKDKGYGFITVENEEKDYYVKSEFINNIYDGDIVRFYPYDGNYKLCNAYILNVVKRSHDFIIGKSKAKIKKNKTKNYIESINPKFPVKAIVKNIIPNLEENVIVYAKLNYVGTAIEANILEIIGHKDDPGIEISSIALEYGFQLEFPKEVYDEIHDIADHVKEEEIKGRIDFRNNLIFTIDGDDSKDFDDAIEVVKNSDGTYKLGVYIADVSHYVKENSPLDIEALNRGTSVYLADRVIPMLPHKLSNGICSLNEGVDRLVLACIMQISKDGKLLNYDICEGVISSKYRMTYNNVNKILNNDKETIDKYQELVEPLHNAINLSKILRNKRTKQGALEFEVKEYKFKLNEYKEPVQIVPIIRLEAEKMIEDFMLMANETIAYHMNIMNLTCMYRIHEKPDQDKLINTLDDLYKMGINTNHFGKKKITQNDLQKVILNIDEKEHSEIYHQYLLRSMMKARYSEVCLGHYGLALRYYCHFTSPIRRYPDLIVHRMIKETLLHPDNIEDKLKHFESILPEFAIKNSISERKSIDCERSVNDMLYAWYMQKHINEQFDGIITSVTSFGMFITLDNGVEGLVHVEKLSGYYEYDEDNHSFSNGKIEYKLGDEVKIVVINANKKTQKLDFMFLRDYNELGV